MGKHYIYSYRLTYFGGTAPCYDDDLLSLAICKRDMRRVMGRNFNADRNNNQDNTYWFIGIVGCGLADASNSIFRGNAGEILYIAKLTDVIDFSDYFSNPKYKNRKDQIYKECKDGKYSTAGCQKWFEHTGSEVHKEPDLQERDWDVQHGSKETFVLISKEYSFVDLSMSKTIECLTEDGKLAKGVGHTWFETSDDSKMVKFLEEILSHANIKHGIENLPAEVQKDCAGGCGKDKA